MPGELLAISSGIIVLFGAPFYLRGILKGHTRPDRTTWLIWSVLAIVAFVSQFKMGARWSLIYVGLGVIGNLIVYGLSLKHGYGGWKGGDKLALIVAATGLVVSFLLHSPITALIGVVIADFAGALLTIQKAFRRPNSETAITWVLAGIASALAAMSVGELSFSLLVYPIYLSVVCFSVPIAQSLGLYRNKMKRRALSECSAAEEFEFS